MEPYAISRDRDPLRSRSRVRLHIIGTVVVPASTERRRTQVPGVPQRAPASLDMMEFAASTPLSFRIGINCGPAVAGVVGTWKFQYDIWGDTVNTASRMESHGETGRIQIAEGTYLLIKDEFEVTPRGVIDVKGKGNLSTWYLVGN